MNKAFQIFKNHNDDLRWHKIIEYINSLDDFDITEKNEITNSIKFLSKTLGKSFLIEASKFNHFLYRHFINRAPWAIRWSIWFAEALNELMKNDKGKEILSKIKSKNRFEEGFSFLQMNYYFSRVGFKILFEERITKNEVNKYPDILLINPINGSKIYLELSSLQIADIHNVNKILFHTLADFISKDILFQKIYYSGKIGNLEVKEAEHFKSQIISMKEETLTKRAFSSFSNDKIEFAISHEDRLSELREWASSRGYGVNSLSGEAITLDGEIERLKNKIKSKTGQLSEEHPNIIAIPIHTLFMIGFDKVKMYEEVIDYIKKFPKLFGVLIYGEDPFATKENRYLEFDGHVLSFLTIAGLKTQSFYFIKNIEFKEIDIETEQMFYSAFRFSKN